MARPREFDEAVALEAATQVFWSLGFEATSLPDLLQAMGLSKSSFYQTFRSKEALFESCLDHYADGLVTAMRTSLQEAGSGKAFIERALSGVVDETRGPDCRRGCLVMNTANEFGQRQPSISEIVARHTKRFEDIFAEALKRAVEDGELPPQHPVRPSARYLVCALSGLKTMAKAGASRRAIGEMATVAMTAIN